MSNENRLALRSDKGLLTPDNWSPARPYGAPVNATAGTVHPPAVHTCLDHGTTDHGRIGHGLQALWGAAGCGCWAY